MILIIDDTFEARVKNKFDGIDYNYLNEKQYQDICTIYKTVKTTDIPDIIKSLPNYNLICNHLSLHVTYSDGKKLALEDNIKIKEDLWKVVDKSLIPRVEFSNGFMSGYVKNFKVNDEPQAQMYKDLFYTNLKPFLDYKIEKNILEPRLLLLGKNFESLEFYSKINNIFMEIRSTDIQEYKNNNTIKEGLCLVYPDQDIAEIIERWITSSLSKNEIIKEINKNI